MQRVRLTSLLVGALVLASFAATPARAEVLKPYILGNASVGNLAEVSEKVAGALKIQGFEIVGRYEPYAGAVVLCATDAELKAAAAKAKNGGFGVVQRVAITDAKGKLQVSYVNPAYLGTAYGLGKLPGVSAKLKSALGAVQDFGSVGIDEAALGPGVYRYAVMMPYFHNIDILQEHKDHKTALEVVERNLQAGAGGTMRVYRVDLPGQEVSVFGVGFVKGAIDGVGKGDKDTDREIMDVVDHQDLKHTAYLPYELMVQGSQVIALRARYRIALHFPDTKMAGVHGFTAIMTAPWGIQVALEKIAGFERNL